MEQLQHPFVDADLHQWTDRWMGEGCIGVFEDLAELGVGHVAADEGLHDLERGLGVGLAVDARDVELRPGFRHVQPTIAR